MEEHQEKKEKKRKWLILLLLLLLLLFAVGIVTGSYIRRLQVQPCNPFHEDADAEIGIMPGMSEQEIQKRLNQVVAKNMMNVTINTEPAFQNGRAKGNLCIENIKQNHVNFIVSIHLDHNDKEIYVSGLLRPNHYIERARLKENLKEGKYAATAYFQAYNQQNKHLGTTAVKMKINILN